ncbi:hypothetical protein JXA85_07115 [Candidatus Woesearchaeota archaeon]|nr:hypothetical protein [Candidatus Woesearchaeota archaeon]
MKTADSKLDDFVGRIRKLYLSIIEEITNPVILTTEKEPLPDDSAPPSSVTGSIDDILVEQPQSEFATKLQRIHNSLYKFLTDEKTFTTTSRRIVKDVGNYLSDPVRLKAIGALVGCVAGITMLKNSLPEITEYFREIFPSLTKETISLAVDTVSNTVLAPIGFWISEYAHNNRLNKKEFAGQVAFAFLWGIARHYVYTGLSNFDELTTPNALLKTSLYTAYYTIYGGIYGTFTVWLKKACSGIDSSEEAKGFDKNLKKKLYALAKDPETQFNWALNVLNMFNPWTESRAPIAGGLLIHYNTRILKKYPGGNT